jgi:hypothetical protein
MVTGRVLEVLATRALSGGAACGYKRRVRLAVSNGILE